jgi:hypothetical protein
METKLEQTNNTIVQQVMIYVQSSEETGVTMIFDHTNVFMLLLHF